MSVSEPAPSAPHRLRGVLCAQKLLELSPQRLAAVDVLDAKACARDEAHATQLSQRLRPSQGAARGVTCALAPPPSFAMLSLDVIDLRVLPLSSSDGSLAEDLLRMLALLW